MLLTECARALRTVRPRDGRLLDWLGRRDDNGIAARETLAPGKVYHSTGFAIADWLWGQATLAPLLWALVLLDYLHCACRSPHILAILIFLFVLCAGRW